MPSETEIDFWILRLAPICKIFVVLLSSMALLHEASAADDKPLFLKFVSDPTQQQHVIDAAKRSTVVLYNPCPDAQFKITGKMGFLITPRFDDSGKLVSGYWKEEVVETGCNVERLLNVHLIFNPSTKSLEVIPGLPGTTHADLVLQKDSQLYVSIAAFKPEDQACKTRYIADTQYLPEAGEAPEAAKDNPWDELWTVVICEKKAQVKMHFIPDETGTTIHTSPKETKYLEK